MVLSRFDHQKGIGNMILPYLPNKMNKCITCRTPTCRDKHDWMVIIKTKAWATITAPEANMEEPF